MDLGRNRALQTVLAPTDIGRWRRVAHEAPDWDDRNRWIAHLVSENRTVLDIESWLQFERYPPE
jgi:hypothetical protein